VPEGLNATIFNNYTAHLSKEETNSARIAQINARGKVGYQVRDSRSEKTYEKASVVVVNCSAREAETAMDGIARNRGELSSVGLVSQRTERIALSRGVVGKKGLG
jgi:hypothetical protein